MSENQSFVVAGTKIEVNIKKGNLVSEDSDAIICPANSYMEMKGGVAGAICSAGGQIIEEEAQKSAIVPVGKAIITGAGKLPAKHVIHSPTMTRPVEPATETSIRKSIRAAMRLARKEGLRSISMPGMGTGTGLIQYDEAARFMCEEIRNFIVQGANSIKTINLVGRSEELYNAFIDAVRSTLVPSVRRALLVVDVQNGFINDNTKHIPDKIINLIQEYTFNYRAFTRFQNVDESPYEIILGWGKMYDEPETAIVSVLQSYANEVFIKHIYSGLSKELQENLALNKVEELVVVGLESDACILKTAYDAFEAGLNVSIISDLCASMRGDSTHENAIALISRNLGSHSVLTMKAFIDKTN